MRVVIRFSLNHDVNGVMRAALYGALDRNGILWTGKTTGTYEGKNISELVLKQALNDFWAEACKGPGEIDHFWMYCDRKVATDDNRSGDR